MMTRSLACALVFGLAGCHSAATSKPIVLTNGVEVRGKGFGDTLAFRPRIIAIDRVDERAAVTLATPAHIVLLGIIPGREIELIDPADPMTSSKKLGGTFAISMQRFEVDAAAAAASEKRRSDDARRCEAESRARQQQAERNAKNSQKRDSSGRIISGPSMAEAAIAGSTDTRGCSVQRSSSYSEKTPRKRIAPRTAADRYLVMLVSSSPVSWEFLNERLATLTAVGADAATTIEAIAAGLYVGTEGKWAGYFVAW